MTWATLFLSLAGPIVARIMAFLGLAVVGITGITAVMAGLKQMVIDSWGGLPADILGLLGVCGANVAIGTIAGAYLLRVGLWVKLKSAQLMFSMKSGA